MCLAITLFLAASMIVLASSNNKVGTRSLASRQYHAPHSHSDVDTCAYLDIDLRANHHHLHLPINIKTRIEVCLCLSTLSQYLSDDEDILDIIDVLGLDVVKPLLKKLVSSFPRFQAHFC
jgi:hypothetical protein